MVYQKALIKSEKVYVDDVRKKVTKQVTYFFEKL